jgi:hypothetical protein
MDYDLCVAGLKKAAVSRQPFEFGETDNAGIVAGLRRLGKAFLIK